MRRPSYQHCKEPSCWRKGKMRRGFQRLLCTEHHRDALRRRREAMGVDGVER